MSNDVDMADEGQASNNSDWVKVLSNDGFSFIVKREVVMASGTLKSMLSDDSGGAFAEAKSGKCKLQERGAVVEKVLEYLMYRKMYQNAGQKEEVPDFQERINPEIALELLMAADFLET